MLDTAILTVVIGLYLLLAFTVLLNNPASRFNRVFAALLIAIPLWCLVVFLEDLFVARSHIDVLSRIDYVLASGVIGLFYWFCAALTRKHWIVIDYLIIGLVAASIIFSLVGAMVTVTVTGSSVVLQPVSIGYEVFLSLLGLSVACSVASLAWKFFTSKGDEKTQVILVGVGLLISALIVIFALVIFPRLLNMPQASVTRSGLYGTLFFAAFSAYAVIKHRFLDIRRTVARSLAYIFSLMTFTALYITAALGVTQLFLGAQQLTVEQTYIFTAAAVVLALTYAPLRQFFDRATDRLFYRHHYNTQLVIREIGDIASKQIDLKELIHMSSTVLSERLKSDYVYVHLFPVNKHAKERQFKIGNPSKQIATLAPHFKALDQEITTLESLVADAALTSIMRTVRARMIVKLQISDELLGAIVFGDKQSGETYDLTDTQLLHTVGNELALAVQNSLRFQEIQDFNLTLQEKVNTATAELKATNRKLHILDESKDEFISMASHQLRTPLTTVKGYISMLLDGDVGPITPQQRRVLEEAFGSAQRMVYLISDFLNVSRLQTGKFELELQLVDMAEIVEQEVRQMKDTAQSRNMKIEYDRPTTLPKISIDENKIRQVIMNFIDNAIYYSKPGDTIIVSLATHSDRMSLRITDHGMGVPASGRHKLFSKFFRATNARKQRPDGTGIGLFMARKVIVSHGGCIIFESQEGKGSTFGFRLPLPLKK